MSALRTYRNIRTGVFFETPCECAGDDWEEVKASSQPAAPDPDCGRNPTPPKAKRSSTKK